MTGYSNGSLSTRIIVVLTAVAVSAIIGVLATIPISRTGLRQLRTRFPLRPVTCKRRNNKSSTN
jgi:hypothetical protein